jgi:shikimate kinase
VDHLSEKECHLLPAHGKYRKYRHGGRRRRLVATVSETIYLSAQTAADTERPRVTVATLVEKAVREYLSKTTSRKGSHLTQRLQYANSLICDVLAAATPIGIAGTGPANIHVKEPRQLRHNKISQKATAAFDQVYELAQSETLPFSFS